MSTIVIRPKPADRGQGLLAERMIDWPEDSVSAVRRFPGDPWAFNYRADILRMKRETMENRLHWKRDYGVTQRRALHVWVFWCPGAFGGAFMGWWTYLVGIGGKNYHGGGCKGDVSGALFERLRELFPAPSPHPLFGPATPADWMRSFVAAHKRGRWCGKPQGRAAVWAAVEGDRVREIHDVAGRPHEGSKDTP